MVGDEQRKKCALSSFHWHFSVHIDYRRVEKCQRSSLLWCLKKQKSHFHLYAGLMYYSSHNIFYSLNVILMLEKTSSQFCRSLSRSAKWHNLCSYTTLIIFPHISHTDMNRSYGSSDTRLRTINFPKWKKWSLIFTSIIII